LFDTLGCEGREEVEGVRRMRGKVEEVLERVAAVGEGIRVDLNGEFSSRNGSSIHVGDVDAAERNIAMQKDVWRALDMQVGSRRRQPNVEMG
jgi:hypothetical protein